MITSLKQLTVDSFIDLLAGNIEMLNCPESETATIIRNIVFEYKEIADSAGIRSYLSNIEDLIKAKMSVVIFTICNNLVALNEYGRVREIMTEYGIDAASMNDQRVSAEILSRLERARSTITKIEQEKQTNKAEIDIRKEFDAQTVALMSYFKIQIDTSVMKATVYAHFVARYNREIKIRLATMNKK